MNPPFFHITEKGREALSRLSRDPSNPSGYLEYISAKGDLNPVADSYLREGLNCFVSNLFKASAVMIGCASESLLLELRDCLVAKLNDSGQQFPEKMKDWKIKAVIDSMETFFNQRKQGFKRPLKESYEAHWSSINHFIRMNRNDAGHPSSIEPISYDSAYSNFLLFPEQLNLITALKQWASSLEENT